MPKNSIQIGRVEGLRYHFWPIGFKWFSGKIWMVRFTSLKRWNLPRLFSRFALPFSSRKGAKRVEPQPISENAEVGPHQATNNFRSGLRFYHCGWEWRPGFYWGRNIRHVPSWSGELQPQWKTMAMNGWGKYPIGKWKHMLMHGGSFSCPVWLQRVDEVWVYTICNNKYGTTE